MSLIIDSRRVRFQRTCGNDGAGVFLNEALSSLLIISIPIQFSEEPVKSYQAGDYRGRDMRIMRQSMQREVE